jgi:hypothetical protein
MPLLQLQFCWPAEGIVANRIARRLRTMPAAFDGPMECVVNLIIPEDCEDAQAANAKSNNRLLCKMQHIFF